MALILLITFWCGWLVREILYTFSDDTNSDLSKSSVHRIYSKISSVESLLKSPVESYKESAVESSVESSVGSTADFLAVMLAENTKNQTDKVDRLDIENTTQDSNKAIIINEDNTSKGSRVKEERVNKQYIKGYIKKDNIGEENTEHFSVKHDINSDQGHIPLAHHQNSSHFTNSSRYLYNGKDLLILTYTRITDVSWIWFQYKEGSFISNIVFNTTTFCLINIFNY